jgi:hypothetical protein
MAWQGKLGYVKTSPAAQSEADTTPLVGQPPNSIAYPFNQLSIQNIKEAVTYLAIELRGFTMADLFFTAAQTWTCAS